MDFAWYTYQSPALSLCEAFLYLATETPRLLHLGPLCIILKNLQKRGKMNNGKLCEIIAPLMTNSKIILATHTNENINLSEIKFTSENDTTLTNCVFNGKQDN